MNGPMELVGKDSLLSPEWVYDLQVLWEGLTTNNFSLLKHTGKKAAHSISGSHCGMAAKLIMECGRK